MNLSDEVVMRRLFADPLELQQELSRRLPGPVAFIAIRTYVPDPRPAGADAVDAEHCDLWLTRWSFEPDPTNWVVEQVPHCERFHGETAGPGEEVEGIELGWYDLGAPRGHELCTASYLTDLDGLLRDTA